jgi:secreted PhoX family phosphatase
MDRRGFFRVALTSAGAAACLPTVSMAGASTSRQPDAGPYGSIDAATPDANGLLLPEGFTSRRLAVAGEVVAGTDYRWHVFPDGAATFDDGDDGWFYVCNSEVFAPDGAGGASAVHLDADGEVVDAYRVLEGTTANCAGGPTPWGTWLSCEERFDGLGQVWEVDPTGETPGEVRPALGRWAHEAVAVDPDGEALYLTEDNPGGKLYRFTPDAYPDLSAGRLDAAVVAADGTVTWVEVADPSATAAPTRDQVPTATVFPGNEGIWYHDGTIVFTSKGDNRVHAIDIAAQAYSLLWDGTSTDPLSGVDNITVAAASGDIFVAEDGGTMEVVVITPAGDVVPFVRVVEPGHEGSEVTGPVFSPDGTRLYFSSQRGPTPGTLTEIAGERGVTGDVRNGGVTWEVTGPFRTVEGAGGASPSTTLADAAAGAGTGSDDSDDGGSALPLVGGAVVALGAAGAGAWWLRNRRGRADDTTDGGEPPPTGGRDAQPTGD